MLDRPFPGSLVPLFQNESKCKTFHMKMSSVCSLIFMQIKVIFIKMVSHLDSLWNRGTRELGNGLLNNMPNFHSILLFQWYFVTVCLHIRPLKSPIYKQSVTKFSFNIDSNSCCPKRKSKHFVVSKLLDTFFAHTFPFPSCQSYFYFKLKKISPFQPEK